MIVAGQAKLIGMIENAERSGYCVPKNVAECVESIMTVLDNQVKLPVREVLKDEELESIFTSLSDILYYLDDGVEAYEEMETEKESAEAGRDEYECALRDIRSALDCVDM